MVGSSIEKMERWLFSLSEFNAPCRVLPLPPFFFSVSAQTGLLCDHLHRVAKVVGVTARYVCAGIGCVRSDYCLWLVSLWVLETRRDQRFLFSSAGGASRPERNRWVGLSEKREGLVFPFLPYYFSSILQSGLRNCCMKCCLGRADGDWTSLCPITLVSVPSDGRERTLDG